MSNDMKLVTIYADGYFKHNCAGWGAVLIYGDTVKEKSGSREVPTKPRIDMIAIIESLKFLKRPCEVKLYTNCQFFVNTMVSTWQRKSNLDLWDELDEVTAEHKIEWIWLKGYGEQLHKQAHNLARTAARQDLPPSFEELDREAKVLEAQENLQSLLLEIANAKIMRDGRTLSVSLQTDSRVFEFRCRTTKDTSTTEP